MYNGMLRNFGYAMVFGQTRETAKNVSRNECQSFLLIIKDLAILPVLAHSLVCLSENDCVTRIA